MPISIINALPPSLAAFTIARFIQSNLGEDLRSVFIKTKPFTSISSDEAIAAYKPPIDNLQSIIFFKFKLSINLKKSEIIISDVKLLLSSKLELIYPRKLYVK